MKVKVIQIEMKLLSSVMSIIVPRIWFGSAGTQANSKDFVMKVNMGFPPLNID